MTGYGRAISVVLAAFCLCAADSPPQPRLTTLGDSITFGVGASDKLNTSYAAIWAKRLGARLTNLGITGETAIPEPNAYFTGKGDNGNAYGPHGGVLTDEVPSIPLDTTIVTLWIGTNDLWMTPRSVKPGNGTLGSLYEEISSDYARYIQATISAIRERTPLAVIAVATNINPANKESMVNVTAGPVYEYRRAMTSLVNEMNAAIAAQDVIIVDLHCDPALYDAANYLSAYDLHPNDSGHARIAQDFYAAITSGGKAHTCAYTSVLSPVGAAAHLSF